MLASIPWWSIMGRPSTKHYEVDVDVMFHRHNGSTSRTPTMKCDCGDEEKDPLIQMAWRRKCCMSLEAFSTKSKSIISGTNLDPYYTRSGCSYTKPGALVVSLWWKGLQVVVRHSGVLRWACSFWSVPHPHLEPKGGSRFWLDLHYTHFCPYISKGHSTLGRCDLCSGYPSNCRSEESISIIFSFVMSETKLISRYYLSWPRPDIRSNRTTLGVINTTLLANLDSASSSSEPKLGNYSHYPRSNVEHSVVLQHTPNIRSTSLLQQSVCTMAKLMVIMRQNYHQCQRQTPFYWCYIVASTGLSRTIQVFVDRLHMEVRGANVPALCLG